MTKNNPQSSILHIAFCAICALLLASCSHEDIPAPAEKVPARFAITTRAEASPEASNNEKINDWWMVFAEVKEIDVTDTDADGNTLTKRVKAPGTVLHKLHRTNSGAVEQEAIDTELPAADYFVFAFANITEAELKEATEIEFKVGEQTPEALMPDINGFVNTVWNKLPATLGNSFNGFDKQKNIPMSGVRIIRVNAQVNQTYSIEVVRMLAKLRFDFTNVSGRKITVNSIAMKPVADGAQYLFPNYDNTLSWDFQNSEAPTLPGATVHDTYTLSGLNLDVATGGTTVVSHTTYLHESLATGNHPTGLFHLDFNITRDGGNAEDLYALTLAMSHITRNDYIVIPVTFTDWDITFDVRFYPPIGGYPAVVKEEKDNEFYFIFSTPGTFEIIPRVRELTASGPKPWLLPSEYELTVGDTDDPSKILYDAISANDAGEITGEIVGSSAGTASVTLTVTVAGPGESKLSPTKKIHIIRN